MRASVYVYRQELTYARGQLLICSRCGADSGGSGTFKQVQICFSVPELMPGGQVGLDVFKLPWAGLRYYRQPNRSSMNLKRAHRSMNSLWWARIGPRSLRQTPFKSTFSGWFRQHQQGSDGPRRGLAGFSILRSRLPGIRKPWVG